MSPDDFKHREPCDPAQRLENALIDLRAKSFDSRGLRVMLYRGSDYTSDSFRNALKELTGAPFSADRVKYLNSFDPEVECSNGELTFARHLQLLTNCYVAALEYEMANR